ncbi:MAG: hypothetical protein H0T59_11430 [Chloroflexi bacterium]|nr:hypothetical protein [Chloroflexota bacterium]
MLVDGIKSRPVYAPLSARPGRRHLIVANDEGALAVLELTAGAPVGFLAKTGLIYVAGGSVAAGHGERLGQLGADDYREATNEAAALTAFRASLETARMGTQVYVAGTENFIAQVVQTALDAGLDLGAIGADHRGSLERRVQCVHCKAITEHVTTQPVSCSGCGLSLLVRDHYSRRIGAFQGVAIDAEELGTAPPPEPVFA